MKKVWLIFTLAVIIVAELTFMSSFYSTSTHSHVSGTSAVVVSKMKYAYARTSIHILRSHFSSPLTLIFSNGTQQEITDSSYTMELFFPRTGDFVGTYATSTTITTTPNSPTDSVDYLPQITLSSKHPVDVDVVQNIPSNFLSWHGDPNYGYYDRIDVFWFKIQGEANIFITGSGMAI